MNSLDKFNDLEESLREERNRVVAQNGNCGLHYELEHLNTKHGEAKKGALSKEYNAWRSMKSRCYNPNGKKWDRYGGRGITVCLEWLDEDNGFSNFLTDMGRGKKSDSLDRIDNDGNYCKENCRWTDAKIQANNTSNNVTLTHEGVTKNLAEWQKSSSIPRTTFYRRYYNGKRGFDLFKGGSNYEHPADLLSQEDFDYNIAKTRKADTNEERKATPIFTGFIKYFPNAIKDVSRLSLIANNQHHPDKPLHWDMNKSKDELDSCMRHLIDYASGIETDDDGVKHLTKCAWRMMGMLERTLTDKLD